jgi:hypothetical protein
MASWSDVVGYIHSNYKVSDETPSSMKLVFETGNLRSQVVMLWRVTPEGTSEEWVQIESPFGELGSIDLAQALQQVSNTVCGGMSLVGNLVTFRHSIPLMNADINEIEWPLRMVIGTADQLERALTGGDKF